MKIWIYIHKAPIRVLKLQKRRSKLQLRRQLLLVKTALSQEKAETKEMLSVYKKYTMRQASKAEMQQANRQFIDLIKGLGIGIVAILPFSPITLPLCIKLGKWVGIDILPSAFSEQKSVKNKNYSAD